MSYAPETNPLAVVLDLGAPYSVGTNPLALDFDLAAAGGGFVYRKPPLAISYRYQSAQASRQAAATRRQHFDQGIPEDGSGRAHRTDQARVVWLASRTMLWDRVPPKDQRENPFSGNEARPLSLSAEQARWEQFKPKDDRQGEGDQAWDVQQPKDRRAIQPSNDPKDHNRSSEYRASDSVLNWQPPPPLEVEVEPDGTLNLQFSPYTPPGALVVDFELVPAALLIEIEPPTRSVDAQPNEPGWSLKQALDGRTIHPWDRKPRLGTEVEFPSAAEPNLPELTPPPEPDIKRTYRIMNASSLIEVTTGTPLEFKDLNVGLDADSFAWTMSATILNRASMDQIRPTADGPAEVTATINGHQWRFVIESYGLDKRFARETYSVKGASRTQLLAAPYAPKRTGRIESQTTAAQVMTEQLQYTGFSVSRQSGLTDYVIPADAWGWDNKTTMEVIAELAEAQGAVVVPDKNTDELHIRHRYKQAGPWAYPDMPLGNIDAIIADTMTISYASQWEPQPAYNAVFISGVTKGVAVDVVRTGTAGDKAAPDNFDDLNVEAYQCRERGLAVISASGNQEIVTIETVLPTSGSPGLIEPAMLVEVRDTREPTKTWRGNVLGTSISVSNPGTGRVTQTVKIERHHY
jgi:hypothetical protein